MSRPAIFLDRDGTLSHEVGYVNHVSRYKMFPWTVDTVRLINRAGWRAVLITNQAVVARGYCPESVVHDVHGVLKAALAEGGAHLDGLYACLHHPTAGEPPYRQDCQCRKPRPGLILQAQRDLDIDLARSWMIGDRVGDVKVGWTAGTRSAMVMTGYGRGELQWHAHTLSRPPDLVAENVLEAVETILRREGAA